MKLDLDLDKKGYLQIDFTFAAAFFIILFGFVISMYTDYSDSIDDIVIVNELQSDAKDLCYILVNNPGSPDNWYTDIQNSQNIGLRSLGNNTLDPEKINALTTENYFFIIDKLNYDNFMYITIDGIYSNTTYVDFGASTGITSYSSTYSCHSVYNEEVVGVVVQTWR